MNQLRRELWSEALNPEHFSDFITGRSPDKKSEKCEVPLASAAFLSPHSALRECNCAGPIGRAEFLICRGFLVVHFAGGKVEGDGRK
jgi:hypothetical protein